MMAEYANGSVTRRNFVKTTGTAAVATTLAGLASPRVHASEDGALRVALIGCGGRGTGAAANAMNVKQVPIKLVAMADVFEDRLTGSYNRLEKQFGEQVDVPEDRKFVGFDAYAKAMDCLRPGDIAIFATPLAFRWVHYGYAIDKGLHVFMEKPLTADGPTSRRMLEQNEIAKAKNLKVGVGLKSRHSRPLQELHRRVTDGEIGDIVLMRGYRMSGWPGRAFTTKWPGEPSELLWQLRYFHAFLWASGGLFNDFYIHIIDHCCWMKNAWPIKAQAVGGRHYRQTRDGQPCVDQNFDNYSVEYIFEDGARLIMDGRCMSGAASIYNSYLHGTKGSAVASKAGDCGPPSAIFQGQNPDPARQLWVSDVARAQRNTFQNEWEDLIDAILNDKLFNEVDYGVMASVVSSLGRKAAHTAQEITLEAMLADEVEYAPGCDKWTMDSPPPLHSDADGKYPIPMPGLVIDREF